MKKVLLIAWFALYACMLQAQTVNLFDESSIGMGDSIDQVKYQVVYDAEYIYEKKYTKTDTIIGRIEEKMLLQIGNKYSAFYSYPIFQRDSTISANMAKGIPVNFSGNGGPRRANAERSSQAISDRPRLPRRSASLPCMAAGTWWNAALARGFLCCARAKRTISSLRAFRA